MRRHVRAGGHPLVLVTKYLKWIPAFAGMTKIRIWLKIFILRREPGIQLILKVAESNSSHFADQP